MVVLAVMGAVFGAFFLIGIVVYTVLWLMPEADWFKRSGPNK